MSNRVSGHYFWEISDLTIDKTEGNDNHILKQNQVLPIFTR